MNSYAMFERLSQNDKTESTESGKSTEKKNTKKAKTGKKAVKKNNNKQEVKKEDEKTSKETTAPQAKAELTKKKSLLQDIADKLSPKVMRKNKTSSGIQDEPIEITGINETENGSPKLINVKEVKENKKTEKQNTSPPTKLPSKIVKPEIEQKKTVFSTHVQTESPKVFTRTIAMNTDPYTPEPPKRPDVKTIETSTSDLLPSIKQPELLEKEVQTDDQPETADQSQYNKDKISHKIIVVQTSSNQTHQNTWNPQELTNDTLVPPTPEGPRFQRDGTQLTYTHPGVQQEMLQRMHTFQTQGLMCDVFIRVAGVDFKAHKIVLAASSPYFQELFHNINTVRVDRLILEGLQPQSVAAMLGYFYMAKLIIDAEDVEDLLDSAYYFKTMEVVQLCTDYLELQLGLHNCFNFYQIALRHNIEGLRLKTFRYICWNFKSIVKELRFLEIDGDILIQIISSKEVKVKCEEEIYEAIWKWYEYNKVDRGFFVPKIVMRIHFELMPLEYLEGVVKKQLYLESELCRKKVDDAINVIKNKVNSDIRKLSLHRQACDNVYLFTYLPTYCHLLDLVTGKYEHSPELHPPPAMTGHDYHVTIKAGKMLYILSKMKVVCFNASKLNWEYFCKGIPITEAGICSTKNSIFVSGGKPNGKQFYELSLSTKEWTKLPDMEHDRRSPATAAMGNTKPRIFVAGGFSVSRSCVSDTVEYYVVSERIWKQVKQPMSVPRLQAAMIIKSDRVLIVGGRSEEKNHTSMDIFDRTTQKMIKNSCHLNETKVEPSLVMFETKIYCIGGHESTSIEVLEQQEGKSSKQKWTVVAKLKKAQKHLQCVVYSPV